MKRSSIIKKLGLVFCALLLSACVSLPDNVTPVQNFDLQRYLGKWYEIARLDHSFERGLTNVSAEYSLRDDGGVKVINRGYSESKGQWKEAVGKAFFVREKNEGYLKVSFFSIFYGAYVVIELDQDNYQYSLVSGPDKSFLWVLSRTPEMDSETYQRLISKASALGYATDELILVEQNQQRRK